ncbi:MAG: polysaccharide pyruvyl transferase family protein [Beijerinckiaceae bacterium]|nr:polysaccharide pyruvyl transferase family protein [Beijerinckiaceae bacterium]
MFTREDADHLAWIRSQTEQTILDSIGAPTDVALLDAPALLNVGDSMIWQGQLAYMNRLGHTVRYISDIQSYNPRRLRKAMPNGGVIALRGGGNFGDIWVGNQRFRERVAIDFPDLRIVQLTQSVVFRDAARAVLANRILGAHPDLTVLIRDEKSLARAAEGLPDVHTMMSFDMALGWDPAPSTSARGSRALVIARDDPEASSGLLRAAEKWDAPFEVLVTDWVRHDEHPARWHDTRARLAANGKMIGRARRRHLPIPTLSQKKIEADLAYLNDWNVDWAVELFCTARAMVVDRLHAHVLASLLGIPHVVLDNDHGKISTVFEAYTGSFSTAHYTTSTSEAYDILQRLMVEGDPREL